MKEMVLMTDTSLSHPPENCCSKSLSACYPEACGSQISWSGSEEVDNHTALFIWIFALCLSIHCCPHQYLSYFLDVESVSPLCESVLCFVQYVSILEYCGMYTS
jgi:hypothetical protein